MNIFRSVYANQYQELKARGKASAARFNGTLLLSIALLSNVYTLFFCLEAFDPNLGEVLMKEIEHLSGRSRSLGSLLVLSPLALVFGAIHLSWGSPQSFQRFREDFELLSAERQKLWAKKGQYYFMGSVLLVMMSLALHWLF